jgi:ferredoxin-type protein NapH
MKTFFSKYRYLLARRIVQVSIMVLYVIANIYGINVLMGNLSSSLFMGVIPLSDPYAVLQIFATGAVLSFDVLLGALIIVLFYMTVGGRAFCSWVCPVNMITDLANYLRRKFGFNQVQKKATSF